MAVGGGGGGGGCNEGSYCVGCSGTLNFLSMVKVGETDYFLSVFLHKLGSNFASIRVSFLVIFFSG